MCILFLYTSDNPAPEHYKVVLAVNRDEMYTRPTKVANFWDTQPNILGGRDMEPGREGGTWLAISKTGRIGSLLNVLQSRASLAKATERKGRGYLVNNLLSTSESTMEYLKGVHKTSSEYNPFTMVAIDVLPEGAPRTSYYTCSASKDPQELAPGKVYGIGNSYIDTPFAKVQTGQEKLTNLIQEHSTHVSKRSQLIEGILDVLKDQEKFPMDPQLHTQVHDHTEEFVHGISSRFVKLPNYGTRTHTIILVDFDNQVFFQEITMKEPITEANLSWTSSTFEFKIGDEE